MNWRARAATLALGLAPLAVFAADVGVSIEISQPGVYGRIDIGRYPAPAVVLPQPVIVAPPPPTIVVQPQPVYVWVPYGHRKDWKKHCYRYNACGVPVYFVRHDWYDDHVRGYRYDDDDDRRGRKDQGRKSGHGKDKYRD